jgi:subtilisin family serine protease
MLALATAASLAVSAYGVQAYTAARETAPASLPVMLKGGTLYMTGQGRNNALAAVAKDTAGRSLFVVQFTGPVKEAYKSALTRLGAELGDYLPENAFLVRMPESLWSQVAGLGFVKGVAPYTTAYKLDQSLHQLPQGQQQLVRVTTFGTSTKGSMTALSTLGVKPEAIDMGGLTVRVDATALDQLAQSTDVVYVEPVLENALFNDKAAGVMGVNPAWSVGLDGKGQVVAITDTGLDTGKNDSSMHPDFQGQIKQLVALGKTGDASDTLGHGTHVAGSVLGTGKASDGLYKGMAPGAKLYFEAVEDKQGGLGGIPEDLSQLFKPAYDAGARIHSNSWGVPATQGGTVYDGQSAAVDRFMWEHPDYTILFAAGNDGDHDRDGTTNYSTVSTPGTAKNAITVGASQNNRPDRKMGENIKGMASFSSRGPTGDGRVKPDVVAPGTWIASTRSALAKDDEFWANHESNSKYGYMGGTSMATPLTAGATALVRQFYFEKMGVTPRADLLKATLINGAAAMDSGLTWKDTGWGRVDINNSLYGRPFKFVNGEKALATGDMATYSYTVKNGQPLKVTLAWTDYPASPSAEKTLVNDLDLVVKGPDGEILGNQMIAKGADHVNNVENVVVAAPKGGTYTVTVKGYNIPQGPQRFSLVVSGSVDGGTAQPAPPPANPNPNPPADTERPKVSVTAPAAGATVSGAVTLTAAATDNTGVSKVIYYVDGVEAGTAATAPFSVTWSSLKVKDGLHSVVANAYDAAGNVGISPAVQVTVKNTGGLSKAGNVSSSGKRYETFAVTLKQAATLSAELQFANTRADLDLYLVNADGRMVAQAITPNLDPETLSAKVAAGTYTFYVVADSGQSDYQLTVSAAQ